MPNWGDMPVWLCGWTTSLAEDPTIHASTQWCQFCVFVTFCQRHHLRIIAGLEGWKRAAAPLVIERLKGPLCRITEARPSSEAASGTLCLVEC